MNRNTRLRVAAATLCVLLTTTADAQGFEPTWTVKFDLAFVDPTAESTLVDIGDRGIGVEVDPRAGAGLRGEYRFSENLGFELGVLGTSGLDVRIGDLGNSIGTAAGVNTFSPVTIGINYHLPYTSRADVYAGPFFAVVNYGSSSTEVGTVGVSASTKIDTDFSWGAIAGIDLPIGEAGWSLHTSLRYIETSMRFDDGASAFESDFDPLIFSIGFAYSF